MHYILLFILFAIVAIYFVYFLTPRECFELPMYQQEECRIVIPESNSEFTCGENLYMKGVLMPKEGLQYQCCKPNIKPELSALAQFIIIQMNTLKVQLTMAIAGLTARVNQLQPPA